MTRIRTLLAVCSIAAVPAVVAGCGGDDSSDVDPETVIEETFNNDEQVSSGNLSLSISGSAEGAQSGNFEASLSGPFQTDPETAAAIPQLDWNGSISGEAAGQSISYEGGLVVTEDNAYVEYGGTAYEVGADMFEQFKAAAEQAAPQQSDAEGLSFGEAFRQGCEQSLEQQGATDTSGCDIDLNSWLSDLSNDGTEDIDGTETDHISGSINVETMVSDLVELGTAVPQAGGQAPTDEQIQQLSDAISEASFDLYSGTDDRILRGLNFDFAVDPSAIPDAESSGLESLDLGFEMRLSEVNEEQTIEAPADAEPIDQLLNQLGVDPSQLGGLGALGGAGGLGAVPGGGGGGGGGGAGGAGDLDPYFECVAEAQTSEEITACAEQQ